MPDESDGIEQAAGKPGELTGSTKAQLRIASKVYAVLCGELQREGMTMIEGVGILTMITRDTIHMCTNLTAKAMAMEHRVLRATSMPTRKNGR
jgi:hypothetical protein